MPNDRIEQQPEALAESEKAANGLKRCLAVEEIEKPTRPPSPVTVESLRKRRWRLVVALMVINGICLINAVNQAVTWPSSASLSLSAEQVTVTYDTQGEPHYWAKVPLKEFPYELELMQQYRHDLLGSSLVNLLLLIVILRSNRQEARLQRMQVP